MKKFSVLALVFVLTATLFTGCRRNPAPTGTTGTTATTHSTVPHTTTTHPSTGIIPDATGIMPEGTNTTDGTGATDHTRRNPGPRY